MENKNVGQVLPDNRKNFVENDSCVVGPEQLLLRTSALFNNTPSSVPVLQPTGQALTGHLPPYGEAASFNTSSTLRERAECDSTGVRGKTTRGFTLIELLVVVLIIGILAAVALPQYQKAVIRSRYVQLQSLATAVYRAETLYFLAHGIYTRTLLDLDIEMPNVKETFWCEVEASFEYLSCKDSDIKMAYRVDLPSGKRACVAYATKPSLTHQICQAETGRSEASEGYSSTYYYPSSI